MPGRAKQSHKAAGIAALVQDLTTPQAGGAPDVSVQPHSEANAERPDSSDDAPQKLASIPAYLARAAEREAANTTPTRKYSEDLTSAELNRALEHKSLVGRELAHLKDKTPAERAATGARFGAGTGLAVGGPVGAVIGAGVGAFAGRGLGMVQSGEAEKEAKRSELINLMGTAGVMSDEGRIKFDDMEFPVSLDPRVKIPNHSPLLDGKERGLFDMDLTHPMVQRATSVARPIARYFAEAVAGYTGDDPAHISAKDDLTALFVNAITDKADNIDTVYNRAKSVADKFGMKEDYVRAHFTSNRGSMSDTEAAEVKRGLDILYA